MIGAEESDDLAKGAIQHFIQCQRLIERLADRVQHQKFPVPAADFLLRLFALGDIKHESLVGRNPPRSVPGNKARFQQGPNFAVLAPDLKFKIADGIIVLQQLHQPVAIGGIGVQSVPDIFDLHQFFAVFITKHMQEGLVKIQEAIVRGRHEDAFPNVFNQDLVSLLGAATFGDVLQHMNNSEWPAVGIVKLGVGGQNESAEAIIDVIALPGHAFTVGTRVP